MWELKTDIFNLFDRKCAVLTSGDMDDFIAMPIIWGTLGMLWGKQECEMTIGEIIVQFRHQKNKDEIL